MLAAFLDGCRSAHLSHAVLVCVGQLAKLALELKVYFKIEISLKKHSFRLKPNKKKSILILAPYRVAIIWLALERAEDFFALFGRYVILEIKHGLFPVSVW